ncbi:MAG TPA: phosphoglycerate kinase [Dehalococcoidia bacterium]|nr:phosphoglycerate kinase [Dehalococcoidia bacterium]
MDKMTVRDIEVTGKRVLVRVDFNVPLDEESGAIADDSRIQATLPTIKYLLRRKAKVILASHLGRPKGKVVDKLRMTGIAQRLSQILGQQVGVATDCIGPEVEKSVASLKAGEALLLENIRFHPEEEANDASFAQQLAGLADIYVNDAFGASHRAHASVVGITEYLPAVAGLLVEKEVYIMETLLTNPAHPLAKLVGGAKISDKIDMLENFLDKADVILIGGGMAATFLKARSYEVGRSMVDDAKMDFVTKLLEAVSRNRARLLLPVDVIIAEELNSEAEFKTVAVEDIPPGWKIADIGPQTVKLFQDELAKCRTVFWNGPMGIYEIPRFAAGTEAMARCLAGLRATTIVGGGSTAEAVIEMGLAGKMTFVSTGGGASLQFLGGNKLPGIEALSDKTPR